MSINLTAQLERNMMAKNYHKVVELFEEFVWRGHHAAAAAADAAAKQAEACTPQASEAAGAQRDGAAAPAAGRAEAGADGQPPPQPQQQGSQRQRRQQQAQRQQLPRDFRPDRRAFGMYYKALKLAHFHYGQWEGLSELRVKTTLDLEMDVHGMHSTSGLEAKLIAAHLNRRPPSDVAQIFDDVRARGGAGAFPFFNLAIRSALRGRQPERAAGWAALLGRGGAGARDGAGGVTGARTGGVEEIVARRGGSLWLAVDTKSRRRNGSEPCRVLTQI
jgi:hypothetical protein